LLLEQEGAAMISAGLSIREDGGHLIVTLRGELDVVDAASVAVALAAARGSSSAWPNWSSSTAAACTCWPVPAVRSGPDPEPDRTSRRFGHLGSHRS
jgi:hypothetical protein